MLETDDVCFPKVETGTSVVASRVLDLRLREVHSERITPPVHEVAEEGAWSAPEIDDAFRFGRQGFPGQPKPVPLPEPLDAPAAVKHAVVVAGFHLLVDPSKRFLVHRPTRRSYRETPDEEGNPFRLQSNNRQTPPTGSCEQVKPAKALAKIFRFIGCRRPSRRRRRASTLPGRPGTRRGRARRCSPARSTSG